MRLYLRNARVRVEDKRFTVRTAFSVKKKEDGKSNKATITLYNLSEDSRGFIEKSGKEVILEAGYGDRLSIIFTGDIKKVTTTRNGSDVLTTIESGDGETQITDAHIELSLASGATDAQIINAAITALGLPTGVIKGLPNTANQNGFAFSGRVSDLLDTMATKHDLIWSVQTGALQIMPNDENTGETAVLLSSNTGLIGLANKKDDGLEIVSLLNTELRPGRLIELESKLLTGPNIYKATTVEHKGDTQEGEFSSKVEGKVA
jgi:hypothetical protein